MIKPLWAVAGVALLGTAGVAGGIIVTSSGGEEEVVQQAETATRSPEASAPSAGSPSPSPVQESQLSVTPNSGPVGTVVVLEGSGCADDGAPTILVFQNGEEAGEATVGAEAVSYDVPTDGNGGFRITYTIPQDFDAGSLQGRGGGPVTPGVYQFISKPPICSSAFTVTE